jgi:phosphatidylserine/phosphatidylglycerophosphate/cardiolipin synthase-like enzyme
MRIKIKLLLAICGGLATLHAQNRPILPDVQPLPLPENVRVYFSPNNNLEAIILTALRQAKTEILINANAITSQALGTEIVRAFRTRNIVVSLILDPTPAIKNYEGEKFFELNGVPVLHSAFAKSRNRNLYCVIDRRMVLTGSYGWLASSVNDAESLLVIDEPAIASKYAEHWMLAAKNPINN